MELLVLGAFCGGLVLCVALHLSSLYALVFGLGLFLLYGRRKGFGWVRLWELAFSGVKTVRTILVIFVLIGMLTALWRAGGTVAAIICAASSLIRPQIFYLLTFLFNCGVSVVTGTSFGTAATMGVVCMSMAGAMGVSPAVTGGAVLSGIYFGDRCSPVSTSALLVSEVTGTDIFDNLKSMVKTAALPFLLSCGAYTLLGLPIGARGAALAVEEVFAREQQLHWVVLLPAAVILGLSLLRVDVRWSMGLSVLLAGLCCVFLQKMPLPRLLRTLVWGYEAADGEVAAMLNGGGILSMVQVALIILVSSTYMGLFRETGLLDGAKGLIRRLAEAVTPFGAVACTAGVTCMIACNQSLPTMLTQQLCAEVEPDRQAMAIDLEDTVVVMAPLVPWSVASVVPLASVGAPTASILAACYLYLLPLTRLAASLWRRRREKAAERV